MSGRIRKREIKGVRRKGKERGRIKRWRIIGKGREETEEKGG